MPVGGGIRTDVGVFTFLSNYFGKALASAADPPAVAEFYLNRISSPASAESNFKPPPTLRPPVGSLGSPYTTIITIHTVLSQTHIHQIQI